MAHSRIGVRVQSSAAAIIFLNVKDNRSDDDAKWLRVRLTAATSGNTSGFVSKSRPVLTRHTGLACLRCTRGERVGTWSGSYKSRCASTHVGGLRGNCKNRNLLRYVDSHQRRMGRSTGAGGGRRILRNVYGHRLRGRAFSVQLYRTNSADFPTRGSPETRASDRRVFLLRRLATRFDGSNARRVRLQLRKCHDLPPLTLAHPGKFLEVY